MHYSHIFIYTYICYKYILKDAFIKVSRSIYFDLHPYGQIKNAHIISFKYNF